MNECIGVNSDMRWYEITAEAFDQKKTKWLSLGNHGGKFEFTVGDQDFLGVFEEISTQHGKFNFAFVSLPNGVQTRSSTENTGLQGPRSLQVFGHVLSAMEEFISSVGPLAVTFGADKALGKDKLYMAMAKRLKPRVETLGYRIAYEEKYGAGYFTIEAN